ncbi:hypothetical protein CHH59_18555 [Shouchella clausii]|nr:hypothetical protein CHH59_18555 [Shouchella clausii]
MEGMKMKVGQANDIATFFRFNQLAAEASDEQSILRLLLDTVDAFIPHVDMAIIYLYDENQKVLRLGAGTGVSVQSLRRLAFKPGESLTGKVFLSKKPYLCLGKHEIKQNMANISPENWKWFREGTYKLDVTSSINVPFLSNGRCLGTFTLNRYSSSIPFHKKDVAIALGLAHQAALAIENVRLHQALAYSDAKEILAQSLHDGGLEHVLTRLEQLVHTPCTIEASVKEDEAIPIIRKRKRLGYLRPRRPLATLSVVDRNILQFAALLLASELEKQYDDYEQALHRRNREFQKLLNGDCGSVEYLSHVPIYCFVLAGGVSANIALTRQIETTVQAYFPNAHFSVYAGHYVVLAASCTHIDQLATYLQRHYQLVIGLSRARMIADVASSYREAVLAAEMNSDTPLVRYQNLGCLRLWRSLDEQTKHDFVIDYLQPLLELEPDYIATLAALIENGRGARQQTAKQLHIHVNTLYQRVKRIEQVLDISFQNERQWLQLMIAYELYVDGHTETPKNM